jgi:hypothetical protein
MKDGPNRHFIFNTCFHYLRRQLLPPRSGWHDGEDWPSLELPRISVLKLMGTSLRMRSFARIKRDILLLDDFFEAAARICFHETDV